MIIPSVVSGEDFVDLLEMETSTVCSSLLYFSLDCDCVCVETQCLLKTGMNSGPNYLKSFYICPQNCGFVKKARRVKSSIFVLLLLLLLLLSWSSSLVQELICIFNNGSAEFYRVYFVMLGIHISCVVVFSNCCGNFIVMVMFNVVNVVEY